ncbi:hypothetical protein V5799_010724 [Amblyomma americanum]|uniref:Uncharacterized protein n=1 Tax=Amblyomma americanum TaxID=6943 RepID=A0AAQ4EJ49_AMBAM
MEQPADYYKNVAYSPGTVNGEKTELGHAVAKDTGEVPSGQSGKHAADDDEACGMPKKPRLEDSPDLEDMKFPREVQLFHFLGSRADEIASLAREVERKYPKLISQQVPRHMRRRAVSHDKRRLPKRLRDKLAHEPDPPKSKRPSRKHRRRPRNLLAEYARRQRRHVWLETHIWHAKRFKMADMWGYRVPIHPTDKGIRAAYRGSAKHALLHDLSYYNCIELIGGVEELTAKLALITSGDTGLTFGAKSYLPGTREGSTVLYHRGRYPFSAIGPVKFLWRVAGDETGASGACADGRQLWLWVHPAIHVEVSEELVALFGLQRVQAKPVVVPHEEAQVEGATSDASRKGEAERSAAEGKTGSGATTLDQSTITAGTANSKKEIQTTESEKPAKRERKASAKDATQCSKKRKKKEKKQPATSGDQMEQEENKVPSAAEVLQLPVYTNGSVTMVHLKDQMVRFSLSGPLAKGVVLDTLTPSLEAVSAESRVWWNQRTAEREAQEAGWEMLQYGNAEAEPRVLGRMVRDPRILLPACKTKVTAAGHYSEESSTPVPLPSRASDSALWEPSLRDAVLSEKMSESELNRLRSQNPLPGTLLELKDAESRIPVVAIRKEGSRTNLGFGSGWDLILPAGWARPFWIALVYRGARASGLRELRSLSLEMGLPCFPFDHPDTAATQQSEEQERRELMAKHLRYPPDKRPSFKKLRISCPFFFPWTQLVREWRALNQHSTKGEPHDETPFYVLRNRKVLRRLAALFVEANKKQKKGAAAAETTTSRALDDIRATARAASLDLSQALVCVELTSCSRGIPKRFDSISVPTAEDMSALKQHNSGGLPQAPSERLRRLRKKPEDVKAKKKKVPRPTVEELLAKPDVDEVVKSCSRLLLGGVVSGDYCFSSACGRGLGYCALEGLVHLVQTSCLAGVSPFVLFRHQHSVQYRYARLRILEEC